MNCTKKSVTQELLISDLIREAHAKELLDSKYNHQFFAEFKEDENLSIYITSYLHKMNPKLATKEFVKTLFNESQKHAYDPVFLLAVMKTESRFRPQVMGTSGEIGLLQLRPETAKWISEKYGIEWLGSKALKNPEYNLKLSALYFSYLKEKFKSKSSRYVNAYNMGVGRLIRAPSSEISEHPFYHKVIKNYLGIYSELKKIKKLQIAKN